MNASPTARSLARLREEGWTAQVVERWVPHARRRIDLFGAFDLVAVRAGDAGVLGIQTTTSSNASARVRKLSANPAVRVWLLAGNRVEIWAWSKKGPRGKRKTWSLVRTTIRLEKPG